MVEEFGNKEQVEIYEFDSEIEQGMEESDSESPKEIDKENELGSRVLK